MMPETGQLQNNVENNVELPDTELQNLLQEAENRLRSQQRTAEGDLALLPHSSDSREPGYEAVKESNSSLPHGLQPYVCQQNEIAAAHVMPTSQSTQRNGLDASFSTRAAAPKGSVFTKEKPTAGSDWFDLPQTQLTPELKRDLQILRMRSVLDPKRHYKKESQKAQAPKYSQVGTVVEGPTEYHSSRIAKRDRKKSYLDETVAAEGQTKRFEARYKDIQSTRQSGKKAFYKNLRDKRRGKGK